MSAAFWIEEDGDTVLVYHNRAYGGGQVELMRISHVDGAVTFATPLALAAGDVGTDELAALAVTTAKLAADAVTGAKLADDAVDSEHLAAGAIDAEHFAAGAVDTAALDADAVDGDKLADDAVDSEHIAAGAIDAEHFAAGAVDTTALGADAVDGDKLADDAVDSEHLAAGGIDAEHFAAGAVDATALADGAVTAAKLDATVCGGANIVVGSLVGDVINVAIQLEDGTGADMAVESAIHAYLSDSADGSDVAGTAPSGGVAVNTDGLAIPLVADKAFLLVSEADGDIDLDVEDSGADTWYLVLVLPNGKLVISDAIAIS